MADWLWASHRWERLAREPGAWEDPACRKALLRARLDYQDALLAVGERPERGPAL